VFCFLTNFIYFIIKKKHDFVFEGFPLRKDFPLCGFVEIQFNELQKRIVTDSVELAQEYRTFNFLSPWQR